MKDVPFEQVPATPEEFSEVKQARQELESINTDQNGRYHGDNGRFVSESLVEELSERAQQPTYAETLNDPVLNMKRQQRIRSQRIERQAQLEEQKRSWQQHIGVPTSNESKVEKSAPLSRDYDPAVDGSYSEFLRAGGAIAAARRTQEVSLPQDAQQDARVAPEPQPVRVPVEELQEAPMLSQEKEPAGVLAVFVDKHPELAEPLQLLEEAELSGKPDHELRNRVSEMFAEKAEDGDEDARPAFDQLVNQLKAAKLFAAVPVSEKKPDEEIAVATTEEAEEEHEASEAQRYGFRNRMRSRALAAGIAAKSVRDVLVEKTSSFMNHPEEKTGRKVARYGLAAAVGAGAIFLAYKGIDMIADNGGGAGPTEPSEAWPDLPAGGNGDESLWPELPTNGAEDTVNGQAPAQETTKIMAELRANTPTPDTISHHAYQHLLEQGIQAPSDEQLLAETQRILDLNGLEWADAERLPKGYTFRIT